MAGRPSNRDERYGQVMEAFVRCVARMGLDGATLSAVADEAGLTRPLIRHHLGNRDEMILALQDYVLGEFDRATNELMAMLPDTGGARAMVDILFRDAADSSPELIMAFAALTAKAGQDDALKEACRKSVLSFEAQIAGALGRSYPRAHEDQRQIAAHGIVALYFNVTSLGALEMPEDWRNLSKTLAESLCAKLEETS